MRIGRILRGNKEEYGILEKNKWYPQDFTRDDMGIESYFSNLDNLQREQAINLEDEDITWLPPVARPGKIICVGRNYAEHSKEQGKANETSPLLFTKYTTSMVGHLTEVEFPPHTNNFDYEVELAVVIGKKARNLTEDDNPLDFVFGYTIANDLTARDVQKSEKQWTRGKAFDQSLPIGPVIITHDEIGLPHDNEIWLTVNGDKRQLSNTSKMIFDIPYLIRFISQVITLEPGDLILTGTPSGVGFYMDPPATLNPGDQVSCGVTGVAELRFSIQD